jgi:hypothetical protein
MAKKDLERMVGRAVLDADFREKLLADPEAAIREAGLELTAEEMAWVKKVDRAKAKAAADEMVALAGQPWV